MKLVASLLVLLPITSFAEWKTSEAKDEMRNSVTTVTVNTSSTTQGTGPNLNVSISSSSENPDRLGITFFFDTAAVRAKCKESCDLPMKFDSHKIVTTSFRNIGDEFLAPVEQHTIIKAMLKAEYFFIEIPTASGPTYQYKIRTGDLKVTLNAPPPLDLFPFKLADDISTLHNKMRTDKEGCYDIKDTSLKSSGISAPSIRVCTAKNQIANIFMSIESKSQKKIIDSYLNKHFGSIDIVSDDYKTWPENKYKLSTDTISASRLGDLYMISDDSLDYFKD